MYLRPERDPEDYLLPKVILLSVDKTKMPSTLFSYQINTDIKQPTRGRCTEQDNNDIGNIFKDKDISDGHVKLSITAIRLNLTVY